MTTLFTKLKSLWDKLPALMTVLLNFLSAVMRSGAYKSLKEYSALIVVVVLFFASNYILRWIDPTAGTYDAGVLQIINLTLVMLAVFQLVGWSIYRTIWPDLGTYMKHFFTEDFKALQPWERIRLALFVWCFYIGILALLSRVVQ